MFKKLGIVVLAVVAGVFILKSTHLGAYARTAIQKAHASLKKEVPLEFQIDSIRNEAAHFMPEMRKQISALAAESVAVDGLKKEIGDLRANLDKQQQRVLAAKAEFQSKTAQVDFDRRGNKTERLRDRLSREISTCKHLKDELKAREDVLEAREKGLEAAKDQLASMKAQKEQWEVQIAHLEAEVRSLRLAQTKSTIQLDDSRFAKIKSMIGDVQTQIATQKTEARMWESFSNEDRVTSEKKVQSTAELIKEADEVANDSSSDLKAQK